jgi:transcriptional regulator with XRE-family HTH domain
MIGDILSQARQDKGFSKTELSRITGINIGHLTHIEKGERNPSRKALRNICNALEISYQQLMYAFDKSIGETPAEYDLIKHLSYNKILAVESLAGFVDYPANASAASIAIKIKDASMEPEMEHGNYVYLELNTIPKNNEFGLFKVNNNLLIRKFIKKNDKITLETTNELYANTIVDDSDEFFIIGKIFI